MDTFPSSPPAAVRADLTALRAALDESGIPPKSLDRNVLVGTWNIRGFGKVLAKSESAAGDWPKRNLRDVLCLAVISRFDVVALQEVKRDLAGLRRLMEALGPNWGWTLTDVTRGAPGSSPQMTVGLDSSKEGENPEWKSLACTTSSVERRALLTSLCGVVSRSCWHWVRKERGATYVSEIAVAGCTADVTVSHVNPVNRPR